MPVADLTSPDHRDDGNGTRRRTRVDTPLTAASGGPERRRLSHPGRWTTAGEALRRPPSVALRAIRDSITGMSRPSTAERRQAATMLTEGAICLAMVLRIHSSYGASDA